jgi:aminocarboxymuconate-semialdehyde decarboxylase
VHRQKWQCHFSRSTATPTSAKSAIQHRLGMRYKRGTKQSILEKTMRRPKCGWEGRGQNVSRREVLEAGIAAAAALAIGKPEELFAQSPAESKSRTKSALGAGGVRAIDTHAHYYPQSFLDLIAEEGKRFKADYRMTSEGFYISSPVGSIGPLPRKFIDLKQRLADMDEQKVSMQAISLTTPMVNWADADFSLKLSRAWNNAASEAHKSYPDRLVALMILPMLYEDQAIDELKRSAQLPGMRGVYMGTNINNRDLDDPFFEPILAKIEEANLPVFLHPLQTVGGERLRPFYLSNLLGNPFDAAIAACHLIFGGVLDRHPKLQFCLPHGGGALPMLIGRVDHGAQVRAEIKPLHLPQPPSAYMQRFTYDTIVHSRPVMEFLIREVGAERIMLGSDYCFDMGYDRPVQFLEQINLPSAQRRMILGGNAAKLLKI